MARAARLGMMPTVITWMAVNLLASRSMMVVTSPMGLRAPPALAAMMVFAV